MTTTYETAIVALDNGFSFLPIEDNGTKMPSISSWSELMQGRPTKYEAEAWFEQESKGIAIVGGAVSGNLEILDFDADAWDTFYNWESKVVEAGHRELLQRVCQGYTEQSPKPGVHIMWRCTEPVEGSQKLAMRYKLDDNGQRIKKGTGYEREVLIETKAEGGYVIIAPSSGRVHPTGKPYTLLAGGLDKVATVTPSEREILLRLARELDEIPQEPATPRVTIKNESYSGQVKAGDDFNERGDWEKLLTGAGWRLLRRHPDGKLDWVRPGSSSRVLHATTGAKGADVFYCFTPNTEFIEGRPYSKFSVYTMLLHEGNYTAAAKALAEEGYGSRPTTTGSVKFTPKPQQEGEVAEDLDLTRFPANDEGNAQAFMSMFGSDFKFSDSLGYLYWTGTHWSRDNASKVFHERVVEVLTQRSDEALGRSEAIYKVSAPSALRVSWAKQMITPKLACLPSDFDRHPDYLNVANGTIDLRTGELLPHRRENMFTHCLATDYRPESLMLNTEWQDFLKHTVSDPEVMVDYLQLAVGYTLTGHTNEEILFFLYGPPRSGKGTFTETLLALMGKDLSTEVDFQTFASKRDGDTNNFDLAPLKAARAVFASESERHDRLNSGKIKALTGGNYVRCSFKHRDHFEYQPQYKIWLSSNWGVNGDADDGALWSRVKVITFPHSHVGSEDKHFKRTLRLPEAQEAILAWAVRGAQRWYALGRGGMDTPETVAKDTSEHRGSADFIQEWLEECTTPDETHWSSNSKVWPSYEDWCRSNGVQAKSQKAFAYTLQIKGYKVGVKKREGSMVARGVQGLRLNG